MVFNMASSSRVFMLQSTFLGPPSAQFTGYCFVGPDYVFGAEGAALYERATGRAIGPGEDGCYVVATCTAEGLLIGADAAGTAKLFWYNKGGVWAVSNSLARLVDHLRENGVRLTPNFPQLHAFSWGITLTKQVNSFATIFNEIRLLPSDKALLVSYRGIEEIVRPTLSTPLPYPEALRSFIGTWTSRFSTLFSDERIRVTLDLTGGVDSRAIFALARTALDTTGVPSSRAVFKSSTAPRWQKDLDVATRLAAKYGVSINRPEPRAATRLNNKERYQRWREVCLGVYLPIYLHDSTVEPFTIHINGGGGENHRHFYPAVPASKFLDNQRRRAPAYLYQQWRADIEEALAYLAAQNSSAEPLILHYREFRNRFHTGRPPLYRTGFGPLTTTLFHQSAMSGGITHAGQLNFDIMQNLIPGLMDLPYDDPIKAPTDENLRNLTLVDLDDRVSNGHTYIGESIEGEIGYENEGPEDAKRPMDLIVSEGTKALANKAVSSFASPDILARSRNLLESAASSGKFEHATMAKEVSFLLATELALGD